MNSHKKKLVVLDLLLLLAVQVMMLVVYPNRIHVMTAGDIALQMALSAAVLFAARGLTGVYRLVWRYVGTREYIGLMLTDALAGLVYYVLQLLLPMQKVTFMRAVVMLCINLLGTLALRLAYQYLYESRSQASRVAGVFRRLTALITGIKVEPQRNASRIGVAIVGAGRVGVGLGAELLSNPSANYLPRCYIDIDREKVGRSINGIPVLAEEQATAEVLSRYPVQEVVIALPEADNDHKQALYQRYRGLGMKVKTYDYPVAQSTDGRLSLREFDVEELLFRRPVDFVDDATRAYYRDKVVMITGGGGSIGSELCRQIARMEPRKLIVADVYENSAYDLQQELKLAYPKLELVVEIITVTDREELRAIMEKHRPDVLLHAAAHKHVPLMERNCVEAVRNNVFGTRNTVEAAEAAGVKKFIMISTDKAVNPTNVMGATKRMCEMIVLAHQGQMSCSCTRFGNVLGSNGSVIPLFRRQISHGGPVTLTDRRIIRYFMTIPEASQLVLTSGAMAKHGELFVLDMGKPVKILDLAESMIRLSGFEPYKDIQIIETGLRPGEKLYEELLIRSEELDRTENEKIFIERDHPLTQAEVAEKLDILRAALESNDDETVRAAMHRVVPTFRTPEEVNRDVERK